MPRQQDPETGKFSPVYDDENFLNALRELGQAGTGEIADLVGCSNDHAYRRLRSLQEEGQVKSRTIGGAKLWERVDGPSSVNPDDPFFSFEPVASGERTDASNTDEYLYGSAAADGSDKVE